MSCSRAAAVRLGRRRRRRGARQRTACLACARLSFVSSATASGDSKRAVRHFLCSVSLLGDRKER